MQVKRYSTQVSASKKIARSGVQSQAIRSFLAKKDHEEKEKKQEELKKKQVLQLFERYLVTFFSYISC